MLVFKTDQDMDNKFFNLEDEMLKLKLENEDLNRKIREISDEMRSTHNREKSLSRENNELKNKIKSERLTRMKEEQVQKERESLRELENKRNKTENSFSISEQAPAVVDFGPVIDLKMKNMSLQQEIN